MTDSTPIKPNSFLSHAWIWVGLLAVVCLGFGLDILLGSVEIPIKEAFHILLGGESSKVAWEKIILNIRIPRAITAVLAGAALSIGGLQMQALFRNPLAGPSLLGITAGASLGVAIVMFSIGGAASMAAIRELGLGGGWIIVLASTLGAAFVMMLILAVAIKVEDHVALLIVGLMIGNITLSLVSIWQYYSQPELIQEYLIWTFGSLGGVTQSHLQVLFIVVVVGILLTIGLGKSLNLLLLGETYAKSMGANVRWIRLTVILTTSLLAGGVTGFCGPIGFVGLAVPHLARGIFKSLNHFLLIPACCLIGAGTMLLCDIIAQLPGSSMTLPINAITALLGSPVVIFVIIRSRNLRSIF